MRPLKGVEPVEFKFKEEYKPFYCPEPRWKPSEAKILYEYYSKKLESGEYFRNPYSRWASRPLAVKKQVHGRPMSEIFEIRPCVDLSQANTRQLRMVPNYPSTIAQIEEHSGFHLYIATDVHSQFGSIHVKAGESQDSQTVWAPRIGKVTSRRLVFGNMNGPVGDSAGDL